MNRSTKTAALTAALIAVGAAAYAATPTENDALSIVNAKVSMTQAINVAEQHAHGKASKAEYEQMKAGWAYDVEVVSANQVFDVKVDADKGTVMSSVADKADRDDDHDERD
jgi:uncharacterized membrane protein YkoI